MTLSLMAWVMQEDRDLMVRKMKKKKLSIMCYYYISFVLLINWIPLIGQKTLIVCWFVLIDFVCDVISLCAVLVGF